MLADYGRPVEYASIVQNTDFVGRDGGSKTTRTLYLFKDPSAKAIMAVRIELLDAEGNKTGAQLCRIMERTEDHSKEPEPRSVEAENKEEAATGQATLADCASEAAPPASVAKGEAGGAPALNTDKGCGTEASNSEKGVTAIAIESGGRAANGMEDVAKGVHPPPTETASSGTKRKGPDSGFDTELGVEDKKAKVD